MFHNIRQKALIGDYGRITAGTETGKYGYVDRVFTLGFDEMLIVRLKGTGETITVPSLDFENHTRLYGNCIAEVIVDNGDEVEEDPDDNIELNGTYLVRADEEGQPVLIPTDKVG